MGKTAESPQQEETRLRDGAGLHLHTLHPSVPVPYLTKEEVASTARSATARLPGKAPAWPGSRPASPAADAGDLGWKTPAEALNEHLLLTQEAGVATTD